MSILRPPALRAGSAVMLVSSSGPPNPERVARGIELLTGWGLSVRLGADVYARHGYFAGTDDQRLASFNAALGDPGIRALVCPPGGYGAQRIVDGLDTAAGPGRPQPAGGVSGSPAPLLAPLRRAPLAPLHAT